MRRWAPVGAVATPIVPSPSNPLKPAFQLYTEIDIPVLAMSAVFASARFLRTQHVQHPHATNPTCPIAPPHKPSPIAWSR